MLISASGMNEYHSVSHCKTTKKCETLWKLSMRVPKMSNNQTLIHLPNNINSFTWKKVKTCLPCKWGSPILLIKYKTFVRESQIRIFANQILRCMTKEWQPIGGYLIRIGQFMSKFSIFNLFILIIKDYFVILIHWGTIVVNRYILRDQNNYYRLI